MISVRVYSNTGELIGPIALDLRKSDAAHRLQQALFTKRSGVIPADLERLDVGTLPVATLSKVYSAADIRKAIIRNAGSLRRSAAAADEVLARVESETWSEHSGPLRKSRRKASDEVAEALGEWSYTDVSGTGRHYARQDGHTCSVKSDGSWSHSGATGQVMSGRDADRLRRFLASVHGAI